MVFSYMIIDTCKIVYANIFSPGTKKNNGGIQLSSTNLSMAIVYTNILHNTGKEHFVYANNKLLVSTTGMDNLSTLIADINNGHVPRKFLPRVI